MRVLFVLVAASFCAPVQAAFIHQEPSNTAAYLEINTTVEPGADWWYRARPGGPRYLDEYPTLWSQRGLPETGRPEFRWDSVGMIELVLTAEEIALDAVGVVIGGFVDYEHPVLGPVPGIAVTVVSSLGTRQHDRMLLNLPEPMCWPVLAALLLWRRRH